MSGSSDSSAYPWEEPAADEPDGAPEALKSPDAPDAPDAPDNEPESVTDATPDSEPDAAPDAPPQARRPLIRKEYYSISEVADLVGLPAHVLRYWESQFSVLNPSKNRSGNRVYQRKEIKLILLVKQLLHDEKYTVEGAKQKLDQLRRGGGLGSATGGALDAQLVQVLREELVQLSELLSPEAS